MDETSSLEGHPSKTARTYAIAEIAESVDAAVISGSLLLHSLTREAFTLNRDGPDSHCTRVIGCALGRLYFLG